MTAARTESAGHFARAIKEAIDCVAVPSVRRQIMRAALGMAGVAQIPGEPDQFRWFVQEPLRVALGHFLDTDVADAVVADLEPIHEVAGSHVRAKGLREDETQPFATTTPLAAPLPLTLPLVLAASRDVGGLTRVARHLIGRARVKPVRDVADILAALFSRGPQQTIVLLDACLPLLDLAATADAFEALLVPPIVVLWGGGAHTRTRLRSLEVTRRWVQLPANASDQETADVLQGLLG